MIYKRSTILIHLSKKYTKLKHRLKWEELYMYVYVYILLIPLSHHIKRAYIHIAEGQALIHGYYCVSRSFP